MAFFYKPFCLLLMLIGGHFLQNCTQPQILDEHTLQEYVTDPNNGLVQEQVYQGTLLRVSYRPTDLLLKRELKHIDKWDHHTVDSLRQVYQSKAYFTISLSNNHQEIENKFLGDQMLYTEALQYLNSGIAQDFRMVTNLGDTLRPIGHLYTRLYNTTGHTHVSLIFDRQPMQKAAYFELLFEDTKLGLGSSRYPFYCEDIEAVPALAFQPD
jgi:hypothetical protein